MIFESLMWTSLDTWIVIAAVLAGITCALIGSFLVLKKMSMMGDAISHAVLPGIALAFLLTGSRSGLPLLIGAGLVGILTTVLVQLIHQHTRLEEGASMGVVFTVLFAIGLILIEQAARNVDIHPEHVLFGAVELVPLRLQSLWGREIPQGVIVLLGVLVLNLVFVVLFFKELRLITFDPALATTLGINSTVLYYALMVMVSITTVAAFEVVGSVLVVAMLIVPGSIAWLLTQKLSSFLIVSTLVAGLSAVLGHIAAITIPPYFGFADTNTAGSMAVVLGLFFLVAMIVAPDQGIIPRVFKQMRLGFSIHTQDVLGLLARSVERSAEATANNQQHSGNHEPLHPDGSLTARDLTNLEESPFSGKGLRLLIVLVTMRVRKLLSKEKGRYLATDRGLHQGQMLLRSHRLWESYFYQDGQVPSESLHTPADVLEHYTDGELQKDLAKDLEEPTKDPQGRTIPN